MILQIAIINLTRNLDLLCQKDENCISSNVKLKEKALNCLTGIIREAPDSEYKKFIESENYSIIVGYLVNILCQLSKYDKSKSIRLQSLEIILELTEKLESFHDIITRQCSINTIISALPGVSSNLFKLIMSDTKLPKNLLLLAIKNLTKFVTIAFLPCSHQTNPKSENDDTAICDNLSIRISFLIDYITTNADQLSNDILAEMLNFCGAVACHTSNALMNKSIKSIVKYIAYMSSLTCSPEMDLKIMMITDNISDKIDKTSDFEIIDCLFKLLDGFESDSQKFLSGERQSKLSMLLGLLRLMPNSSMTTFMETSEKRIQFLNILIEFTEFSSDQPFLFLADVNIDSKSLETCNERIYTFEKRFKQISDKELNIIREICLFIGKNLDWLCLNDILKNNLTQFSQPSNLFITNLILKGCSKRIDLNNQKMFRFTMSHIEYFSDKIHEEHINICENIKRNIFVEFSDILKVVIAIETINTLMDIHMKNCNSLAEQTIVLKDLLCHILNWSSSNCRAISEASLSCLSFISKLYGKDSSKSLIEANIDYIINGVMLMLDNFAYNSEITSVLAITFKLSSIDSFYYFKDVYEKVFKLLGEYQSTSKTKSIALLFYRTVSILSEWKKSNDITSEDIPLTSQSSIESILYDIDIKRRLKKLNDELIEADKIRQKIDDMKVSEDDVINDVQEKYNELQNKKTDQQTNDSSDENVEKTKKKKKSTDIELTEKILYSCVNLISSNCDETKILALKTAAYGLKVLRDDEDTLLPLVHQLWSPLLHRLTKDYNSSLEVNLSAFKCLISMAICAKDFIKSRTLESVIPRLCLFLETQSRKSYGQKEYGPYCMTIAYKCQLEVLTHLGALAYHIQLAYSNLWQVMRATYIYMDNNQVVSLQKAAKISLHYLIALDADCAYYFAKKNNQVNQLPFELIFDAI